MAEGDMNSEEYRKFLQVVSFIISCALSFSWCCWNYNKLYRYFFCYNYSSNLNLLFTYQYFSEKNSEHIMGFKPMTFRIYSYKLLPRFSIYSFFFFIIENLYCNLVAPWLVFKLQLAKSFTSQVAHTATAYLWLL